MSVYKKHPGSAFYSYDFHHAGRRFAGPTGAKTRREAEREEERARLRAVEEMKAAASGVRQPMTFEVAYSRYWTEVGQHHRGGGADDTLWSLTWLKRHVGADRRLVDIDDAIVAGLVAIRRGEAAQLGHNRKRKPKGKRLPPQLVAPATVNRTVTQPLRKILNRARRVWKEPVTEIAWREHMLREPRERVREMKAEEEAALFAALRPDYHPAVRFALVTGLRLSEIPRVGWEHVDWGGRQITVHGKGGKVATIPMPPEVRELLWPLRGDHEAAVFTYAAARARDGRDPGRRYPITRNGLQITVRRALAAAGVRNFRFHDTRHTAATRVLRASGNLKIVQRLLRHDQITTTAKYAHAMDEDVMAAMQLAAERARAAQVAIATAITTEITTEGVEDEKKAAG